MKERGSISTQINFEENQILVPSKFNKSDISFKINLYLCVHTCVCMCVCSLEVGVTDFLACSLPYSLR